MFDNLQAEETDMVTIAKTEKNETYPIIFNWRK